MEAEPTQITSSLTAQEGYVGVLDNGVFTRLHPETRGRLVEKRDPVKVASLTSLRVETRSIKRSTIEILS